MKFKRRYATLQLATRHLPPPILTAQDQELETREQNIFKKNALSNLQNL